MADITVESLSHVYSEGTPFRRVAIEDINISIPHGQLVGIIGHTGSGKSTFTQHLNALLQPTTGRVLVGGQDINADKISRRNVKWQVGLVFQYPEHQLFEETVYQDIAFGPRNMKLSDSEVDERVREAAYFVGVDEKLFDGSPLELSGGQKRRVAIAGVIAMRPGVLILDEPTAGLDPAGCRQIMDNIRDYRERTGSTVIVVSHSMDEIAQNVDRIAVLSDAHVLMSGTPREVFARADELVAAGLDVPQVTRVAMALRAKGLPIDPAVYTVAELKAALLALRKGGAVC